MKILDRIALVLFSILMLIISIIICLVIFGLLDVTTIYFLITSALENRTVCNVLIGVSAVIILLSLKAIFFSSSNKEKQYNDSILLENDDGKLIITKETLIGMVDGVVTGFPSVKSCQTRVGLDQENNLSINLNIETTSDTIIKELSNNLQIRIKEKIKESLDLDVKNINIRIKNIQYPKTENTNDN